VLSDAVARLERWRQGRAPIGHAIARSARAETEPSGPPARPRRPRQTEVDVVSAPPAGRGSGARTARAAAGEPARGGRGGRAAAAPVGESLADALRDKKLGEIDRARRLARQRDRDQAARELLAIARRATGDARANALGVLVSVGRRQDGAELARYLGDAERSVQRVAVDGVVRTGYAAAVPALAALVVARDARPTSSRSQLAASAATAMKALSGRRGGAALTGYLSADDPRVREAACVALTIFPGSKQARPLLERLLGDRDVRVARAAKRALAALQI